MGSGQDEVVFGWTVVVPAGGTLGVEKEDHALVVGQDEREQQA